MRKPHTQIKYKLTKTSQPSWHIYTLQSNTQTPSATKINKHQSHTYSLQRRSSFLTIIQSFVASTHAKATYTNQIQPDQSETTIMAHTLCKPTLKHHQYKHHQQHKSINVNPALAYILQRRSLTGRTSSNIAELALTDEMLGAPGTPSCLASYKRWHEF